MTGTNNLTYNDSDPDGDPKLLQSYTQAQHGTLTYYPSLKELGYSPQAGYTGPDSFTYQLCDNLGMCSSAPGLPPRFFGRVPRRKGAKFSLSN